MGANCSFSFCAASESVNQTSPDGDSISKFRRAAIVKQEKMPRKLLLDDIESDSYDMDYGLHNQPSPWSDDDLDPHIIGESHVEGIAKPGHILTPSEENATPKLEIIKSNFLNSPLFSSPLFTSARFSAVLGGIFDDS